MNIILCSEAIALTQPALDDLDGAIKVLDGLGILCGIAKGHTQLVVCLSQQAAVGGQVLQLQVQAFLEVLQGLTVIT